VRRFRAASTAVVLATALSSPGAASILTLVGGTLDISIGSLPLPKVTFSQNAPAIPISVSIGGGFTEPASIFTGSVMFPTALFTGVPLFDGFTVASVANLTKSVAPGAPPGTHTQHIVRPGGGLGGPGPLSGAAFLNILELFNLVVPLSLIGNTGAFFIESGGTDILDSIFGTGWTTAAVQVTGLTTGPEGSVVNTVTFVGYDNRTPNHQGVVQLVSPFKVIQSTGSLHGVAVQTLTFVPEPGTLLLLGSGAVGLVLYARRRS
jgi:hypothetical protein